MASPEGDDDVADVTMEGEQSHEEEQKEEQVAEETDGVEGEEEKEEEQAQEVVELDEEEAEGQGEEGSEWDDVEFVGSVEDSSGHRETEEDEVVVLDNGASNGPSTQERSRANTEALLAANGVVTPATLEAELQCIICQYAMFKPVSAACGHSFCRVCLMDSLLTRSIEEAQCPICRVEILQPFAAKSTLALMFPINVTLWNLIQLLTPSVAERIASYQQEEEQDFTHKLDQLDAKWKIFIVSERAARFHGDHDEEASRSSGRWEDDHERHEEYPVLKVENTQDGNLHISRNIVLDTTDANEDGLMNMRVGMAIVEFPSVFELYNEHQECSVNVIKLEEDEEMADGMPFFMNEDGDDDGFVCGSYYNEISLDVCDEGGNCVMERTRGAQGGVVTFPGLRFDVPGGVYTFRFSDDLYGLKLSITTRLREPHEISETPVGDYVSLIHDEAREANRRNRGRHHDSDDEEENDEEGNEWDDSFIVDDLNGEVHTENPVGRFSDDEGHWEYQSDDEAADEEREQRRVRRRQRLGRRSERDVQIVDEEHEGEHLSGEGGPEGPGGPEDANEHEDEAEYEVRPGRRNVRLIEEAAFSSDGEAGEEDRGEVEAVDEKDSNEVEEHIETHDIARPRRRNANQIVDSEDEEEGAPGGSDDEQKENDIDDAAQGEHGELENGDDGGVIGANEDEGDDDAVPRNSGRKVKRTQWFQGDESEGEDKEPYPDAVFSPDEDAEVSERRPRKRARARDRQVRVVDEAESDEEEEQMERSIVAANSAHACDDADADADADEDTDGSSQFRQVHQFYDEEVDERHEFEDAQQDEDDAPDYPDEEEDDDENDYD